MLCSFSVFPSFCPDCSFSLVTLFSLAESHEGYFSAILSGSLHSNLDDAQPAEKFFEPRHQGKSLHHKQASNKSQKIQTEEKLRECTKCGKMFIQKANLVVHQRTQTGEKTSEYCECAKAFKSSYHLIRHERTHTRQAFYKGIKSVMSNILHERTHMGGKPECSQCEAVFDDKSTSSKYIRGYT